MILHEYQLETSEHFSIKFYDLMGRIFHRVYLYYKISCSDQFYGIQILIITPAMHGIGANLSWVFSNNWYPERCTRVGWEQETNPLHSVLSPLPCGHPYMTDSRSSIRIGKRQSMENKLFL